MLLLLLLLLLLFPLYLFVRNDENRLLCILLVVYICTSNQDSDEETREREKQKSRTTLLVIICIMLVLLQYARLSLFLCLLCLFFEIRPNLDEDDDDKKRTTIWTTISWEELVDPLPSSSSSAIFFTRSIILSILFCFSCRWYVAPSLPISLCLAPSVCLSVVSFRRLRLPSSRTMCSPTTSWSRTVSICACSPWPAETCYPKK